MRIKRGSCRVALILGSLVIKARRIRFPIQRLREAVELLFQGRWKVALAELPFITGYFRSAILQNWSEFQTWRNLRAEFLAPVYFSCGVVSVARYIVGEQTNLYDDLLPLWKKLSPTTRQEFEQVDPHCTCTTANILRTPNGYRFVDYGDSSGELERFLQRNQAEVTKLFRRKGKD